MTTLINQYCAKHRYARLTARKARLIADMIRGRSANEALELLEFAPQRAASFYLKVVKSAVANAAQEESVDLNRLVIVDARADDGPMLNNRLRYRPGPQGRAMPFSKKTSHLTVVVAVLEDEVVPAEAAPVEVAEPAPKKKAKKKTAKKAAKKAPEKASETASDSGAEQAESAGDEPAQEPESGAEPNEEQEG